jgi:hypothetical protein
VVVERSTRRSGDFLPNCHIVRRLSSAWWLLALCGIANPVNAAVNLLMLKPGGALGLRRFALPGAVWDMGMLAVAASCVFGIRSHGREHRRFCISDHTKAAGQCFGLQF